MQPTPPGTPAVRGADRLAPWGDVTPGLRRRTWRRARPEPGLQLCGASRCRLLAWGSVDGRRTSRRRHAEGGRPADGASVRVLPRRGTSSLLSFGSDRQRRKNRKNLRHRFSCAVDPVVSRPADCAGIVPRSNGEPLAGGCEVAAELDVRPEGERRTACGPGRSVRRRVWPRTSLARRADAPLGPGPTFGTWRARLCSRARRRAAALGHWRWRGPAC